MILSLLLFWAGLQAPPAAREGPEDWILVTKIRGIGSGGAEERELKGIFREIEIACFGRMKCRAVSLEEYQRTREAFGGRRVALIEVRGTGEGYEASLRTATVTRQEQGFVEVPIAGGPSFQYSGHKTAGSLVRAVRLLGTLAHAEVPLEGGYPEVRKGETNFGDLLAEALLAGSPGADLAVFNAGSLRASLPAGPVTRGDLLTALPYRQRVVEVRLKGETVKAVLENAVAEYEKTSGAFLQVAGMAFSFDPALPAGSRVKGVRIRGEALVRDREYRLVTLEYVARGGDGYAVLKDCGQTPVSSPDFQSMVEDHIRKAGKLRPVVDGRIRIESRQ